MILHVLNAEIWFSDRIILAGERGLMKINKRILFDKSLQRNTKLTDEDIKLLKKHREKILTENPFIKNFGEMI